MTRGLIISCMAILTILGSFNIFATTNDPNELNFKIEVPNFQIDEVSPFKQILTHPDYSQTIDAGKAVLPFKEIFLVIPYGKKVKEILVKRINDSLIENFKYPAIGEGMKPYSIKGNQEERSRLSISFFPKSMIFNSAKNLKLHNFNLFKLNIFPVYKGDEQHFYQASLIDIKVILENDLNLKRVELFRENKLENILSMNGLLNSSDLKTYPISNQNFVEENYDYLIVTTNSLKNINQAYNLQKLTEELFGKKHLRSKIITVEDVKNRFSGRDIQEKIRNAIKEEYKNYGPTYLLLAGDETQIPSRKMFSKIRGYNGSWQDIEGQIPADFYYGCLDGDFNSNGNAKFGEPNDGENGGDVDFLCELTVGRFPVENATELSNMVKKTVHFYQASNSRPRNLLLLGEKLFAELGLYGADYMDQLVGESNDHHYTTHGFDNSWKIDKLYEKNGSWSGNTVKSYIRSNNYLMLNHLGHSNDTYSMKISNWFFSGFENQNPFLLYTQGCFAGNFTRNDSIIEDFILAEKGPVAAIANSHYGLGPEDPDPASTVTPGASQILNRYFVHYLMSDSLGQMKGIGFYHQKSKEEIIRYIDHQEARWVIWVANLMGDPALTLWD